MSAPQVPDAEWEWVTAKQLALDARYATCDHNQAEGSPRCAECSAHAIASALSEATREATTQERERCLRILDEFMGVTLLNRAAKMIRGEE